MLFYPDQYFYSRATPRSRKTRKGRSNWEAPRSEQYEVDDSRAFNAYQMRQPQQSRASRQQIPDEYMVIDEEELAALRAFRESRQRRDEYGAQQRERLQAELERRARQKSEARMQAQVEANARAAAREYLRRQISRQQAILEAQQAERERQQRLVMEQLRQQFGLFAVPSSNVFRSGQEGNEYSAQDSEDVSETARQGQQLPEQEPREPVQEFSQKNPSTESQEQQEPQDELSVFDPIRTLIEALAPYPFMMATESSDEEADTKATGEDAEEDELDERAAKISFEPETELDGPTCETASDESDPVYVEEPEFRIYSATPPVPLDYDSAEEATNLKDRQKERQGSAPINHVKKAKTKPSKKESKKDRKDRSSKSSEKVASSEEIGGLLTALGDELQRLKDAYTRLSGAKPSSDLREVISRLEAVKIGYSRSEEIYNKLDEVRAGKEGRKLKHEITTEAVALADKYEHLLSEVYAQKEAVAGTKNSSSSLPGQDFKAVKHQVLLEEVQDDSD